MKIGQDVIQAGGGTHRPLAFHICKNIPAGGTPSRLRALRAQRRDKRRARNALDLTTARTRPALNRPSPPLVTTALWACAKQTA